MLPIVKDPTELTKAFCRLTTNRNK